MSLQSAVAAAEWRAEKQLQRMEYRGGILDLIQAVRTKFVRWWSVEVACKDHAEKIDLAHTTLSDLTKLLGHQQAADLTKAVGTYSLTSLDLLEQSCVFFGFNRDMARRHVALIKQADAAGVEAHGSKPAPGLNANYDIMLNYTGNYKYKAINKELRAKLTPPSSFTSDTKACIWLFSQPDCPSTRDEMIVHRCVALSTNYKRILLSLTGQKGLPSKLNTAGGLRSLEGTSFVERGLLSTSTRKHGLFCSRRFHSSGLVWKQVDDPSHSFALSCPRLSALLAEPHRRRADGRVDIPEGEVARLQFLDSTGQVMENLNITFKHTILSADGNWFVPDSETEYDILELRLFVPRESRCCYSFCPGEREVVFPPGTTVHLCKYLGTERNTVRNPVSSSPGRNNVHVMLGYLDVTQFITSVSCNMVDHRATAERAEFTQRIAQLETQAQRSAQSQQATMGAYESHIAGLQRRIATIEKERESLLLREQALIQHYDDIMDRPEQESDIGNVTMSCHPDSISVAQKIALMMKRYSESPLQSWAKKHIREGNLRRGRANDAFELRHPTEFGMITRELLAYIDETMVELRDEYLRDNPSDADGAISRMFEWIGFDVWWYVYDGVMRIFGYEEMYPESMWATMWQMLQEHAADPHRGNEPHHVLLMARNLLEYLNKMATTMRKWVRADGRGAELNATEAGYNHIKCSQLLQQGKCGTEEGSMCSFTCGFAKMKELAEECKAYELPLASKEDWDFDRLDPTDAPFIVMLFDLTSVANWWVHAMCVHANRESVGVCSTFGTQSSP